ARARVCVCEGLRRTSAHVPPASPVVNAAVRAVRREMRTAGAFSPPPCVCSRAGGGDNPPLQRWVRYLFKDHKRTVKFNAPLRGGKRIKRIRCTPQARH